jgi:hypothetical protein
LGDGVFAECKLAPEQPEEQSPEASAAKADLSSLTAMLSAKWKQGGGPVSAPRREPVRSGQIRSFRILSLDAAKKKIEVELAS